MDPYDHKVDIYAKLIVEDNHGSECRLESISPSKDCTTINCDNS